jgi:hypothetical protein
LSENIYKFGYVPLLIAIKVDCYIYIHGKLWIYSNLEIHGSRNPLLAKPLAIFSGALK